MTLVSLEHTRAQICFKTNHPFASDIFSAIASSPRSEMGLKLAATNLSHNAQRFPRLLSSLVGPDIRPMCLDLIAYVIRSGHRRERETLPVAFHLPHCSPASYVGVFVTLKLQILFHQLLPAYISPANGYVVQVHSFCSPCDGIVYRFKLEVGAIRAITNILQTSLFATSSKVLIGGLPTTMPLALQARAEGLTVMTGSILWTERSSYLFGLPKPPRLLT